MCRQASLLHAHHHRACTYKYRAGATPLCKLRAVCCAGLHAEGDHRVTEHGEHDPGAVTRHHGPLCASPGCVRCISVATWPCNKHTAAQSSGRDRSCYHRWRVGVKQMGRSHRYLPRSEATPLLRLVPCSSCGWPWSLRHRAWRAHDPYEPQREQERRKVRQQRVGGRLRAASGP